MTCVDDLLGDFADGSLRARMSGSCCVEMTTASTRTGLSPSYSTVTCDLPSGRRYGMSPFLRTAASMRVRLCASTIGSGISSAVSRHAKPNIMPWSPAPVVRTRRPCRLLGFERLVDAHRDVGRLFVDRDADAARFGVEADGRLGVADLARSFRARCAGCRCSVVVVTSPAMCI